FDFLHLKLTTLHITLSYCLLPFGKRIMQDPQV
ncbi:MAG: hypothetical protein PWR11_835, partial [Bacillota bacterium]|nr:hypothetical protein [Bacillota bacterium]